MNAVTKDRTQIDCRNCKFWSFDVDMAPFCVHRHAGPMGTDINAMRGSSRPKHARGEQCGPKAKHFVQGTHRWAKQEANA